MTLEESLGYVFNDKALLEQALTHKSYFNENSSSSCGHNECLEFLGDAVIDLVLSDLLMIAHPQLKEGQLSKARASLVNETTLAVIAKNYVLNKELRLGKGEQASGGANKPRLLASAFEALVGALYKDAGFLKCHELLKSVFEKFIAEINMDNHFESDYKTRLQEVTQEKLKKTPEYILVEELGPDHQKVFNVEVRLGNRVLALGEGKSKKAAEQAAAKKGLEVVK